MNKRTLVVGALLLATLWSGWQAWNNRQQAPAAPAAAGADYILHDFEIIALDAQGKESLTLRAPRLTRSSQDETLDISKPLFLLPDNAGKHWQLAAATGWVSADGEQMILRGGVKGDKDVVAFVCEGLSEAGVGLGDGEDGTAEAVADEAGGVVSSRCDGPAEQGGRLRRGKFRNGGVEEGKGLFGRFRPEREDRRRSPQPFHDRARLIGPSCQDQVARERTLCRERPFLPDLVQKTQAVRSLADAMGEPVGDRGVAVEGMNQIVSVEGEDISPASFRGPRRHPLLLSGPAPGRDEDIGGRLRVQT